MLQRWALHNIAFIPKSLEATRHASKQEKENDPVTWDHFPDWRCLQVGESDKMSANFTFVWSTKLKPQCNQTIISLTELIISPMKKWSHSILFKEKRHIVSKPENQQPPWKATMNTISVQYWWHIRNTDLLLESYKILIILIMHHLS